MQNSIMKTVFGMDVKHITYIPCKVNIEFFRNIKKEILFKMIAIFTYE